MTRVIKRVVGYLNNFGLLVLSSTKRKTRECDSSVSEHYCQCISILHPFIQNSLIFIPYPLSMQSEKNPYKHLLVHRRGLPTMEIVINDLS